PAEDLDALLLAFEDAQVDFDLVADGELQDVFAPAGLFHQRHQFILHAFLPSGSGAVAAAGCGPRTARAASGRSPRDCRSTGFRAPPCRGRPAAACTAGTPAGPTRCATPRGRSPRRPARPARSG